MPKITTNRLDNEEKREIERLLDISEMDYVYNEVKNEVLDQLFLIIAGKREAKGETKRFLVKSRNIPIGEKITIEIIKKETGLERV